MNSNDYPALDIDAALSGAPVAWRGNDGRTYKVFLHVSITKAGSYIAECANAPSIIADKEIMYNHLLGMWVEPIVFHRWHLLHERVVAIRKSSQYKWQALNSMGDAFASYNELTLKGGFFPDCEVGTVIKRPTA